MKQLLFLWLVATTMLARAQTVKNNVISLGRVDSVTSAVLKEQRKLWVYVPASASDPAARPQRYPVVYLLDGDAHFASVVGMIQQLSAVNGNLVCPEMIVVGILNTDRTRDLTPTHVASSPDLSASRLKTSGGGENFTTFLEKELLPYIDAHYPSAPYRTLIGHSLGGLLVLNTVVQHAGLFNNYVALDPSVWWDGQKLLRQTRAALAQPALAGRGLFVGLANTMPTGFDTVSVRRDTASATDFMRAKLTLRDELAGPRRPGLRVLTKYYPHDTHSSVPLPATYDALRFLFRAYTPEPQVVCDLFEPNTKTDPAPYVAAHYQRISALLGYPVLPPEATVNDLADFQLQNKQPARALALLQLNARNYPSSFQVHDSLGDYYRARGQLAPAAAAYTKALQLQDTPATREKLRQLRAKK